MQRWLAIAALCAALLSTPVWGQRGGRGGMSMGGTGHGGFVSHSAGGFSRGSVYAGAPYGGWGYRRPPYSYPYHYHPFYPGRYPWRWGYPWTYGYGWYSYPGWGWSGDVGYSSSYPAQTYPAYVETYPKDSSAYAQNSQIQQDEIDRLNQEVARLREERPPQSAASQPQPKAQIHAETVLVFRDKHAEEIQNYAIVGKTLWVFTEMRARKIPITELDVPATAKANEDRGIDFRLTK